MNWSEFFHMGGYGFYVWGSYLLTFVVIIAEVAMLINRKKKLGSQINGDSKSNGEHEL